MKMKLKLE